METNTKSTGSPVPPIIGNLHMEYFKQWALESCPGLTLWVWFFDDTFVMVGKKNPLWPYQRWEHQVYPEGGAGQHTAFLETAKNLGHNGPLSTKVYRKPTHTNHYLQFSSHHPLIHKLGAIGSLKYWANSFITKQSDINEEVSCVGNALGKCGYPKWAFRKGA